MWKVFGKRGRKKQVFVLMPLLYNFFFFMRGYDIQKACKKNTKTKMKQTETEQEHIEFPDATSSLKILSF